MSRKIPLVMKAIAEKNKRMRKNDITPLESQTNSYCTELNPIAPEERQILGGGVNRRSPAQHESKAPKERQNNDAAIAPSEL